MRFMWRNVLPTLMIAAAVHMAAVWVVPRIVMAWVMHGAAGHVGINLPYHMAMATAASRTIPLPSPDLLYSLCALDVSAGPVEAEVHPGADYLSLAVFDAATDNVFVTNDEMASGKPIRLLITGPGWPAPVAPAGTALVHLHTSKGLLLLRALAATPALRDRNDIARHTLTCHVKA